MDKKREKELQEFVDILASTTLSDNIYADEDDYGRFKRTMRLQAVF